MVSEPVLCGPDLGTFCTTFHRLAEAVNTPFSLRCSMLLRDGSEESIAQLISSSCHPSHYREGDAETFAGNYLMQKIASKLPSEFSSANLLEPTLRQFCDQETRNAATNRAVLSGEIPDMLADIGIRVSDLRRIAKRVLGRAPSLAQCCDRGGWGPGSTVCRTRQQSVPEAKCTDTSVTYRLAKALHQEGLNAHLPWWNQPWTLVPGNLMFTVKKNAKSLRTASAEPAINGWVQKGIGACFRQRLLKVGIDLNDQTINQGMAMMAQRLRLATVDLRGASNSNALEIFRMVLPTDWMRLIDISRSERGCFDNRVDCLSPSSFWFDYEMVSSMGNGFTFELESLLFYCIARAAGCHSDEVWIYGDDIIVPQEHAPKVVRALEVIGHSLNREKSFLQGLFFESCGAHIFNGTDVTPFYISECLDEPKDVLRIANELRLFATRLELSGYPNRQYLSVYRYLVGRLPTFFRARGPAGGGLCLFSNIEEIEQSCDNFTGMINYHHLLPCFEHVTQPEYLWSYDQVLSMHLDSVHGPLPLANPFRMVKGRRSTGSLKKRCCSLDTVKAVYRRYHKLGIGETPYLMDYRLFQMGGAVAPYSMNNLSGFIPALRHLIEKPFWLDVRDAPNSGNSVSRVKYRKWNQHELAEFSKSDGNRCGELAHKVVSGSVDPGRVVTLTQWRH